ncbi:MAG: hypothetical protein M0Z49_16755 [Chloroflexi bacterium]|nr:hypothetical protein [Chloroflexota bacterium]
MEEDGDRAGQSRSTVESRAEAGAPAAAAGHVEAEPKGDRCRGIARVDADHFAMSFGALGMARGREIVIGQAAVGLAAGEDVALHQSFARLVLAREEARLQMAAAATVAANHVEVGRGAAIAVLIARRVEGDVRPLLDWRGALAFGAAFGLVASVFGRGRRAQRPSRAQRSQRP